MTTVDPIIKKIQAVEVSPKFMAILDCLLGVERRTTPALTDIIITANGLILGQAQGDLGHNQVLGEEEDLRRNIRGVAKAADLNEAETASLLARVDALHR
jgi:hypothetical protein